MNTDNSVADMCLICVIKTLFTATYAIIDFNDYYYYMYRNTCFILLYYPLPMNTFRNSFFQSFFLLMLVVFR